MKRYIVLGTIPDITAWRRENGHTHRDVITVSTTNANALRGLGSRNYSYEVITLESWARATPAVNAAVRKNLEIMKLTGCTVS